MCYINIFIINIIITIFNYIIYIIYNLTTE